MELYSNHLQLWYGEYMYDDDEYWDEDRLTDFFEKKAKASPFAAVVKAETVNGRQQYKIVSFELKTNTISAKPPS